MKIALLGSAPSSLRLAPFEDESWTIWGCSPGAFPFARRVDAWFELHRWEPHQSWFPAEYVEWMSRLGRPVWMIEPVPEIPTSQAYPKEAMLAEFGPYWFTSSLSWMFALALHEIEVRRANPLYRAAGRDERGRFQPARLVDEEPDEIGIWGVDMSAAEEYGFQRAGCHRFIEIAWERGVKITCPPESDLLRPPPLYGLGEADPQRIKLMARKAELEGKLGEAARAVDERKTAYEQAVREHLYFQGAVEDCQYMLNTWCQ